MKKLTLAALLATVAFTPAFALEKGEVKAETKVEQDAKGNLEKTTKVEQKDAAGNKSSVKTETDVDVDADGEVEKTEKKTEVTDPKGLGNKEKVVTKDKTVTTKEGATETSHTKEVNGKKVEETKTGH